MKRWTMPPIWLPGAAARCLAARTRPAYRLSSRAAVARTRLDRCLAPWVFVLTGIVFNILAAVITHYFINLILVLARDLRRN